MNKISTKKFLIPSIYVVSVLLIMGSIVLLTMGVNDYMNSPNDFNYVPVSKFDYTVKVNKNEEEINPVVNIDTKTIKPYISENVKIGKYFYDFESDEKNQENSLIFYENTYIQNSGIDYISDEIFDIVSVLDGEVSSIEKDELLGNIIKIKHDKNIITVYESLGEILVKEGDNVNQNTIIAKSGTSKLNPNYKNALHFEVYQNGKLINPEKFYNLKLEDL